MKLGRYLIIGLVAIIIIVIVGLVIARRGQKPPTDQTPSESLVEQPVIQQISQITTVQDAVIFGESLRFFDTSTLSLSSLSMTSADALPQPLSATLANISQVQWSPDKTFALLKNNDNSWQVYVIQTDEVIDLQSGIKTATWIGTNDNPRLLWIIHQDNQDILQTASPFGDEIETIVQVPLLATTQAIGGLSLDNAIVWTYDDKETHILLINLQDKQIHRFKGSGEIKAGSFNSDNTLALIEAEGEGQTKLFKIDISNKKISQLQETFSLGKQAVWIAAERLWFIKNNQLYEYSVANDSSQIIDLTLPSQEQPLQLLGATDIFNKNILITASGIWAFTTPL